MTHADVRDLELVSDNAWATTYRLSCARGARYLKILPRPAQRAVSRIVQVARDWPGQVPEVLAAAADQGWILFAAHEGDEPSSGEAMIQVSESFGSIQAAAARSPMPEAFDVVDVTTLPQSLMAFLEAAACSADDGSDVGASYFIGREAAARYACLLGSRMALLQPWLQAAAKLPNTLDHGDLQARNVAIRPNGEVVFFDWDDAAWGPAGMGLAGLLPGCAMGAVLLGRWMVSGVAGEGLEARCLQAYVRALVDGGYATESALLPGLIGSLCAGRMRFLISFGRYPGTRHRADCADTLGACLSDLLDVCDWLATRDHAACMRCIDDYERQLEWHRASRLLQDMVARAPQYPGAWARYANAAYCLGDMASAHEAAQKAFALAPESVGSRTALARTHLGRLELAASEAVLDGLPEAACGHPEVQELRSRTQSLRRLRDCAGDPRAVPRIEFSARELSQGHPAPETLAMMVDLFKTHGALQVDNLFDAALMGQLQAQFAQRYGRYCRDERHPDALVVGDKRLMVTMTLDDCFGQERLVASSLVLPFMRSVLGDECILGAYTAVISLPGSEDQAVHKDHSALFEEAGWEHPLPSFAVQLIVPLLALDAVTGTTRVYKGSQRFGIDNLADLPCQDPLVPLGSCLLIDYSVAHRGLGNRSTMVRPLLNLVYSRPWFRDCRNYHLQPPLRFSRSYLENAPASAQQLVDWRQVELQTVGADPSCNSMKEIDCHAD